MPGIPSLFGDGATLGLGGGPIRSQDQNIVSFGTGNVNFGTGDNAQTTTLIAAFVLIGFILWLKLHSSR